MDTAKTEIVYEMVIFLGAASGRTFGNVTVNTPFSNDALICSSYNRLVINLAFKTKPTPKLTLTP